jgi:putative ABC transport system ATP-binding protein
MMLVGADKDEAQSKAEGYLLRMGITQEKFKRFPANLSGGEQQRVAIARSLASRARIILADEPTGNLDIENTENIIELLRQLAHDDGLCVIIVTHDVDVADKADIVYKMRDGILVPR